MTAELELYEGDAARVRVGQAVKLRSSALSGDLLGQVTRIGMLVGRQQRIDTSPAANLDARVVKATVVLDAASSSRARSLVGLEVRRRSRLSLVRRCHATHRTCTRGYLGGRCSRATAGPTAHGMAAASAQPHSPSGGHRRRGICRAARAHATGVRARSLAASVFLTALWTPIC